MREPIFFTLISGLRDTTCLDFKNPLDLGLVVFDKLFLAGQMQMEALSDGDTFVVLILRATN